MKQNSHTESIVFHTPQYVSYTEHSQHNRTIKLIAFYLPQYHSIPENDAAWGKGFTDWNNVAKARPLLKNHYQPRIPGELGFYNLKDINKQKRQIELAKNYGIHGFCYHFYWFAGKMVMSTPLKQLLLNEELDFPFCINWANENWTKRWDGLDNEIILEQKHSVEDDLEFIQNVLPIFSDKRYIRVGDRPLLMIYRPDLFPDFSSTVKRWRKYALDYGENLFIVCTHSFDSINPETILCDAAVEFSPNNCGLTSERVTSKTKQTDINLFNYESLANKSIADPVPGYVKFRGLCPGWDNTSRRKNSPTIFYNSSPELYGRWLESLALYTFRNLCEENQFVFINAWNEWAEGAYLEPDAEYGYSYLESTWNSISKFTPELLSYTHTLNTVKKYADTAVIMHLYYPELMDEMAYYINNLDVESDVFISITPDLDPDSLTRLKTLFPDAYICLFENRGRDILPFIKIFEKIYPLEYKSICKIHTKKSPHRIDGDIWRKQMLESVAGSKETTHNILKMFENDQNLGLVIPDKYACHFKFDEGSNKECIKYCTKELGIKMVDDFIFPAGSMFWARPECLKQLSFLPSTCHFDLEQGQLDGTMAHSLERLFGLLCKVNQFKTEIIESPS